MAKSKTEICNLAVGWLGGKRMTSVDDDASLEARLCRANYDLSRQAVLEEREWTFAVKRIQLTPLAVEPVFGYKYKFLVPSDLLRVIGVYDPLDQRVAPVGIPYTKEENNILADLQSINIKYMMNLENTNRFPGLFTQALASHIASNIAISLTENNSQFEKMRIMYEDNLNRATTSDSLQGSNEHTETSQLENVRRMFVRPS